MITLYYLGRPIRDVETEYGCFGAVSPVPSMARHALSVNEAVHPALLESTRESSIKLNADKRIYVVVDWTKPESFLRYTLDRDPGLPLDVRRTRAMRYEVSSRWVVWVGS